MVQLLTIAKVRLFSKSAKLFLIYFANVPYNSKKTF
nr:MAG TPA: hypothetical protein [Bacteriophage sp.]